MATVTIQKDGNLLVELDYIEKATVASLPDDRLQQYITLYLQEQGKSVVSNMFAKLDDSDKAVVMQKFAQIAPVSVESVNVVAQQVQ